ncbi:NAD-dependent epimerase/dehydratase family protein [Verrucomicrobiota bacterium]
MKILVTGAAGYIGSVLVPYLLSQGHAVRALDSLIYRQTSLLPCFINPDFEFIEGDVRDRETVKTAVQGVDMIVNLAALVGAPVCAAKPDEAWEINHKAALMLEGLRSAGQGYLFPNTTSGYGTQKAIKELCVEETPMEPISIYGKTKVQAEQELMKKKDVVCFRFTTVFGLSPRLRLDLMPNDFMWRALRQGSLIVFEPEFQRSFIHITDIARCICFTIEHFDQMKGRVFNVGDESMNKTKQELAEKIADLTGCYLHFNDMRKDPDKRNYFIAFKRIQEVGFRPQIGWEAGLQALYNGLKTLHWSVPFANVEYY